MSLIRQHPVLSALLVNVILFSCVFAFAFPIYNSGDDVYLLYTLSGGFGQAPTELLHYHYGMHPYMGWMLKNLFTQYPGFNWYSLLFYLFQCDIFSLFKHYLSYTWFNSNVCSGILLLFPLTEHVLTGTRRGSSNVNPNMLY